MNIYDWIERWAAETPDKQALVFEKESWTWREFEQKVLEYSAQLQGTFGIDRGDRIAYLGHNSADFLFLLFASASLGAIIAPLNWRLTQDELMSILRDAEPKLLIADQDMQPGWTDIDQLSECTFIGMEEECHAGWQFFFSSQKSIDTEKREDCGDDPLLLVYTSGTTGLPKGALLSHNSLLANAKNSVKMHRLSADDHSLVSLPFFHVGGLNILTTPTFYCGGTVTVQRVFNPQAMLTALMEENPTRVPIVSAQMPPILGLPGWADARFPKLISVTTGASPVSPAVYSSWQEKGVAVLQVYGATETCPLAICTSLDEETPNIRTTGRPVAACEVKIVDDSGQEVVGEQAGEILIRGDSVMSAYWRNPSATKEVLQDGWYASGDIAYQDENGLFYIVDRKKDLIISGGENIFPGEIEKLLLEHEDIAEVAVIAAPDDKWGEVPIALVKPVESRTPSESEIIQSLQGRLGRYKFPRAVIFVDDFPRNSLGKIQKFILRDQLKWPM